MGGLAELGFTHDSRSSFLESAGSQPITGPDTPAGSTNRNLLSIRHSRLNLTALLPDQENWPAKFFTEFDFMGDRESWPLFDSGDTYYSHPSFRFRHYYFTVEHNGLQITAGQTWSLFGWQPHYRTATVSVSPGPGVLSQRHKQFTAIQTYKSEANHKVQIGLSFGSASAKTGGIPNVDLGIRYAHEGRLSKFSSATGSVREEPFSIGLSGTFRKVATGTINAASKDLHNQSAYAGALNFFVPLIAHRQDHSLSFTAETSLGTGYTGSLSGFSANLDHFSYAPEMPDATLSKGLGGFDSAGKFHLLQLRTLSSQLQYHFPEKFFSTLGHSQVSALNVRGLTPVAPGFTAYDRATATFVNVMRDFNEHVRAAAEFTYFTTNYVDGTHQFSRRYQLTLLYRF